MVKLLLKAVNNPVVTIETNNVTVQATGTVTAYAIQANATLTPLFILNLVGDNLKKPKKKICLVSKNPLILSPFQDTSVSARVFVSNMRLAGAVTLNKWVTNKKAATCSRKRKVGPKGPRKDEHQSNFASFAQNDSDPGDKLCGRV